MAATAFFIAGIVFLAVLVIAMMRSGGPAGGRDWSLAWIALYGAGLCAVLSPQFSWLRVGYPVLGVAYCAFLYAGTLRYCGKPVPRALWMGAAAVAVTRLAAQPWLTHTGTQFFGAGLITFTALASTRQLVRHAPRSPVPAWTWALALALPLNAAASIAYAVAFVAEWPAGYVLGPWLMSGVLTGGVQAGALVIRLERSAAGEVASTNALIEAFPFGLLMTDAEGRIRALNENFAEIFNLSEPERLIGAHWNAVAMQLRDRVEPDDVMWMERDGAAEGVAREDLPVTEYRFLDGRITRAEVRNMPTQDGQYAGQLWLVTDITEERRVATRARRAQQLETLGRLASGVAHDFNNQLTAMLGNAEAVRGTLEIDDPRYAQLAELEEAALYCSDISRDLLEFARPTPRRPSETDLGTFLPKLVARFDAEAPEARPITLKVAADAEPILADRTQLERVITNLVRNARDAAGPAGKVLIDVRMQPGHPGPRVSLSVSDDGVGMDANTRDHIFEPFFSTKETGNGLGLAIVYGIVSAHGGEVNVESARGAGARFETLWRPSKQPTAALAPERVDEPPRRQRDGPGGGRPARHTAPGRRCATTRGLRRDRCRLRRHGARALRRACFPHRRSRGRREHARAERASAGGTSARATPRATGRVHERNLHLE